jgi:hypothetical protein
MNCVMTNKRLLIMSAATAGLFALAPAPLRAADEPAAPAEQAAEGESIQLSIVLAKGGG